MEPMCPICHDGIDPLGSGERALVISRKCGHMFHDVCLDRWIQLPTVTTNRRQQNCPTCKVSCTNDDKQRVFGQWRVYPVCSEPCNNQQCDNALHKHNLSQYKALSTEHETAISSSTGATNMSLSSFTPPASPPLRGLFSSVAGAVGAKYTSPDDLPAHMVESDMHPNMIKKILSVTKSIVYEAKREQPVSRFQQVRTLADEDVKTRCRLVASRLRKALDDSLSPPWQCFVRYDSHQHNFAASITHVSGFFAYYFVDEYSLVVFKTT